MSSPLKILPTVAAQPPSRQPQENVPQTASERERVRDSVKRFLHEEKLVPPIPIAELRKVSERLIVKFDIEQKYLDFTAVLLNNELWRETLATIPFELRLIILPKCLRVEAHCPAPLDEFGLLCKKCGMCSIQDLQTEAERLGYAVLVAEGSPIVMAIIETGKIDAIVGVSCLSVLERAFPYMEAAAIPGVAIPLLQDDCVDTSVDLEWIWDVIQLTAEDKTRRLNLTALKDEVSGWFTTDELNKVLGPPDGEMEQVARTWLLRAGKRWRPFLTVAMHQALLDDPEQSLSMDLQKVAIAVECFHKASLIHDDIEDMDAERYGEEALHEEHGVAVALNVGDFLIGEGYRLLATCDAEASTKSAMLKVAAEGHRTLCRGQGTELAWTRQPKVMQPIEVINIFREKTAPAFEVSLRIGSLYAGEQEGVAEAIAEFSRSLGIAYQIRDDLDDLTTAEGPSDLLAMRP
ncbi:MAG: polyprenyl synthetase family protein, partial [Planctomycetes bacterium]|nr:polyprenyl synthetase family protein [Planctomycetota bacterium]